jgi:hypothetical protein
MIVYNVTTKVASSIADAWLHWLNETHIPAMLDTGCFTEAKILQLLETDDSEGPTYAVQYMAESKALYNRYIERFAEKLRQDSFDKWGNQFIAFRTIMKIVH